MKLVKGEKLEDHWPVRFGVVDIVAMSGPGPPEAQLHFSRNRGFWMNLFVATQSSKL